MNAKHETTETPDRPELPQEDLNEQFRALMEGLRTTLPGVQVLFAFLLTLPFYSAFGELSHQERVVYYMAFASAALATVLLVAPSVHQRMRARQSSLARRHPRHVMAAVQLANAGTVLAALALVDATYLVSILVFGNVVAAMAAAVTGLLVGATWVYLPVVHWRKDGAHNRAAGMDGTT